MEKKNKIILASIIILTLIVIGFCIYSVLKNDKVESDAVKFRNEYMELNDKVNEASGKAYVNVTLTETNTIDYITESEAVEILKDGTGVIYFGFSTCPWCRNLVSPLASVAESKKEPIYYLDVLDIRSSFEVEEGKVNKIKDGTEEYYQILELLDEKLEEFYLYDEAGNKYDTNEKRLYAPTLVAVKNGEITDFHVSTVESHKSGYDELNEKQKEELEGIITRLINSKSETEVCTKGKC